MLTRVPELEGMTDKESVLEFNAFCYRYLKKIGYDVVIEILHREGINRGRIIELGSGGCHLSIEILKSGGDYHIIALDISEEMTRIAIRNMRGVKGINCVVGDVCAIPFLDNSFDAAVSFASLHHWDCNPASVFQEVNRVVKEKGVIVIYDLKRDKRLLSFLKMIPSKKMQELFYASVHAAYTADEIKGFLKKYSFSYHWRVHEATMTIGIVGRKYLNE